MVDGKGLSNLFQMLIAKDVDGLLPSTPIENIPSASDVAFNASPSMYRLAFETWEALILPRFPQRIRTRLQPTNSWPRNIPTFQTPALNKAQLDLILLDRHTLAELKLTAQSRNIKTVTPLIHSAAYVAVYSMIDSKEIIRSAKPISVRGKLGPEATTCTGNFASCADWLPKSSSKDKLWSLTRDYANSLSGPKVAQEGLDGLAVLNYIPNEKQDSPPQKQPSVSKEELRSSQEEPNSWQYYFRKNMMSEKPYSSSFEVTNVGLFQLDEKVQNLVWARAAMPIGSACTVHVAGYKVTTAQDELEVEKALQSTLTITVTSRQGGVTNGQVFALRMKRALTILCDADVVPEETTIEDMVKLIAA